MITSPPRRDTLAIYFVYGLCALMLYAGVRQLERPADNAQAQQIIFATAAPTPALPTAMPAIAPIGDALPTPAWPAPAPAPDTEPAPAVYSDAGTASGPEIGAQEAGDYLDHVGAQAAHSPRGDVAPPEEQYQAGPILYPDQGIVIDPSGVVAPVEGIAVAVPPISEAQAAIIGARTSDTCPSGQVFYPRTGCHQPGSGGPMPGAVGEVRP